jgi:UDP-glucose 4-epimerase
VTIFISGVAGFIGCRLAGELLKRGETVAGFDNLCRGSLQNLNSVRDHPNFTFSAIDLADLDAYRKALRLVHAQQPVSEIWHMAANSDIPAGVSDPNVDFRDTFLTTFNSLILMKELGIGIMAFASSSAVYGDLGNEVLTEDIGPLFPISNYGAMKLASEAAISAALESYLQNAFVFRFPNVIGVPATHGVIQDFMRKLKATPGNLDVLGDGTQQKSYLHVDDLIDALLYIRNEAHDRLNYFNVAGNDDGVTVKFIAEAVVSRVAPGATITFGQGNRGWVGDVPKFKYSTLKLSSLGWRPRLSSVQAIEKAVNEIAEQEFGR